MLRSAMGSGGGVKRTKAPLPENVGRYQVLCALGEGGMGSVVLARVLGPGGFERLVAIKLLHEHLSRREGFVRMFLDEARIAARIRHPNVVPVLEVGEDNGRHFIAMEYVSGETLARAMNRLAKHGRRLPPELAVFMVWAASEGLHAAHEQRDASGQLLGVVHRDVSPENLIVGYDGAVRITDFGIAKANDQSSFTMPGTWKGKAGYLSPEQILSRPIDRRADVFSLGIVLWEATIGRPLFKSENPFASAEKIRDGNVPPPTSIYDDYPPELEAVVMKALALDPSQRYETARAFGDDLRRYLARLSQLIGPVEIEQFMGNLFADRLKRRRELEHRAAVAPTRAGRSLAPGEAQSLTIPVEPLVASSLLDGEGAAPLFTPDFPGSPSAAVQRSAPKELAPPPSDGEPYPEPVDRPSPPSELAFDPSEDPLLSAMTDAQDESPPPQPAPAPVAAWADHRVEARTDAVSSKRFFVVLGALLVISGLVLGALAYLRSGVGAQSLVPGQTSTSSYRRFDTPQTDPRAVKGKAKAAE